MNIIQAIALAIGILAGIALSQIYDVLIDDPAVRAEQVKICSSEKEDMVSKAEMAALQARIDREREFRAAAEQARVEDQKRAVAANLALQQRLTDFEATISSEPYAGESVVTKEDRRWLDSH